MQEVKPLIGFVGQGFIGKNYADDFERRGYTTVRYALEASYAANKEKIKGCDVVFIAVPTPTTPQGFDASVVHAALGLVGEGRIAVIKSTVLPGTTVRFQQEFPSMTILYSPEFLSEATAAHDAAHPFSNIVGMSVAGEKHENAAALVHSVLPRAPFSTTCASTEAEIIKYTHNLSGYVQVVLFNLMYDLAQKLGYEWENIGCALKADPLICNRYATPVHKSGRGAGGHCFIKDLAALRKLYEQAIPWDHSGLAFLDAAAVKNRELLLESRKDLDLLEGVYGSPAKE